MNKYFGYIRVSTAKQGEQGVSLQQQRDAIERYASRNGQEITSWFEEQETAAKRGRPIFNQMIELLKKEEARGVIIHKIDRSARNLKDWADLGELIDKGMELHFANESLDLHSRGGRLSADIQAVVAADYVRNLREETRKGFYGRLKQGLYPMPAPLGYLDRGKGQAKVSNPLTAPLIKRLFELYGSGRYSMKALVDVMYKLGLRTKSGKRVVETTIAGVLANPFYIGLIRLKSTGQTFQGIHKPLVSASLFEQVRRVASGKSHEYLHTHNFMFRRFLRCVHCGYCLVGERQKGNIYYRCHTPECGTKGIREEAAHQSLLATLKPLMFTDEERPYLKLAMQELRLELEDEREDHSAALRTKELQLSDRLAKLTDAYLDGLLEKELFEERKRAFLMERQKVKEMIATPTKTVDLISTLEKFLELAGNAYLLYETGFLEEKRELLEIVTSNRLVSGKTPMFTLDFPFQQVANRAKIQDGGPSQGIGRTFNGLLKVLVGFFESTDAATFTERLKVEQLKAA